MTLPKSGGDISGEALNNPGGNEVFYPGMCSLAGARWDLLVEAMRPVYLTEVGRAIRATNDRHSVEA